LLFEWVFRDTNLLPCEHNILSKVKTNLIDRQIQPPFLAVNGGQNAVAALLQGGAR